MKIYLKNTDDESIYYYSSISINNLNNILNDLFDDIEETLKYYANLIKEIFSGKDYDEHYYELLSLIEELNDIKIIISIMNGDNND